MTWRNRWEALRESPDDRAFVLAEEAKHALAANVYTLRKERGLSQTEMARLSGTKQPNISEIETADANVTVETLGKVAAALGVDVAELFAVRGNPVLGSPESGTQAKSGPLDLGSAVYVAEGFAGFHMTQEVSLRRTQAVAAERQSDLGAAARAWS